MCQDQCNDNKDFYKYTDSPFQTNIHDNKQNHNYSNNDVSDKFYNCDNNNDNDICIVVTDPDQIISDEVGTQVLSLVGGIVLCGLHLVVLSKRLLFEGIDAKKIFLF